MPPTRRTEIVIPSFMTRQIVVAHDRFLEQTLTDPQFVQRIAAHVQHARLSAILPSTPGATVLELGCGPGKYVAILDRLGFDVTGVDPVTFPSWEILRRQTRARLLDGVRAEQLPFADGTFDHVVCLGTLLYVDGRFLCLGELGHLLWLDLSPTGYKELARTWLFAARETWSTPVVSHGLLYISQHGRDSLHGTSPRLLCYDLRAGK